MLESGSSKNCQDHFGKTFQSLGHFTLIMLSHCIKCDTSNYWIKLALVLVNVYIRSYIIQYVIITHILCQVLLLETIPVFSE